MTVVIDCKEKHPWAFPEGVKTVVRDLRQGDYALEGDGTFSIERKSLDDFIQTVGTSHGWEKFQKEMQRMYVVGTPHNVIIVEGDFASFCFHEDANGIVEPQHEHPNFTPQLACKRIADLTVYYRTSVLFACDAECAAGLAFQIFCDRQLQLGGRILPKDLAK